MNMEIANSTISRESVIKAKSPENISEEGTGTKRKRNEDEDEEEVNKKVKEQNNISVSVQSRTLTRSVHGLTKESFVNGYVERGKG